MTAKVSQAVSYYDTEFPDGNFSREVREQLKETDENRRRCLEVVKKKLLDKEDLNPCTEDDFLLAFLRVSKFDSSRAYRRILEYYAERRDTPEIFEDYTPSTVKRAESAREILASPYRTTDLSGLVIIKRKDYDPSKCHYSTILRALSMMCDLELRNPLNQMCGFTLLVDFKGSSWRCFHEYTPSNLKVLARLFQKISPARIRAIHFVNSSTVFYLLYSCVYPFLTAKMKSRIFLQRSIDSLQSQIDPKFLPEEYGGCVKESELVNLFHRLYDNEEFFRNIAKYGYVKKK